MLYVEYGAPSRVLHVECGAPLRMLYIECGAPSRMLYVLCGAPLRMRLHGDGHVSRYLECINVCCMCSIAWLPLEVSATCRRRSIAATRGFILAKQIGSVIIIVVILMKV